MPATITPDAVAVALNDGLRLIVRRLRQRQVAGELSGAESQALNGLVRHAPVSAAELARTEGISPQSMGTTIAALEALRLVSRAPDPTDGRRVLWSVTAAGRRRAESKRAARAAQLAVVLQEFSPAELRTLSAAAPLLERVARGL